MTPKADNGTELLVEKFSQFEAAAPQPKWLLPLRKAGIASFAEAGFPTLHDEDWRFTNVAPIAKLTFQLAARSRGQRRGNQGAGRSRLHQIARPSARVRERIFLRETFQRQAGFRRRAD